MLAVRCLGVGTVLTTIHRYRDAEAGTRLDMPAYIVVAAIILMATRMGNSALDHTSLYSNPTE